MQPCLERVVADVKDLEDAPDNEVEAAEEEILDQATVARTIAERNAVKFTVGVGLWVNPSSGLKVF